MQGKIEGDSLIGNYVVLDKLASGGMGIVFWLRAIVLKAAWWPSNCCHPSLARDPGPPSEGFKREAKAAATLIHPKVVGLLDADVDRGLHFLVMEYVEGRDLARLVREQGPLSLSQAIDCVIQAARGLKAAFQASVVHRDIKPSNLLLDSGGTIKILDMGLARLDAVGGPFGANQPDASLTQSNVLLGTIDYMSPEQASNPRNADHRSDIYSLGCTLHYLLTGRPPYSGDTLIERLIAHREQPIPSLSDSLRAVSPSLDGLLRRVLAKSPTDRFSTLDELIAGLEACLPRAPTDTSEWTALRIATDPLEPSGKRRTTFAVVILGIAAAVGLLLTVITLSRPGSVPTGKVPAPVSATPVLATTETVREPKSKSPGLQRPAPEPDGKRPAPKTIAARAPPPRISRESDPPGQCRRARARVQGTRPARQRDCRIG